MDLGADSDGGAAVHGQLRPFFVYSCVGWGVDRVGMTTYRIEQRTTPGGLSDYGRDWRIMGQAYLLPHDDSPPEDEVCYATTGIAQDWAENLVGRLVRISGGVWEYRIVECCEACGR